MIPIHSHSTHGLSALSPAQERAMDDAFRAYDALPDVEQLRLTADMRREDMARFQRSLDRGEDARAMLAQARRELAEAELQIARCELRDLLLQPDATAMAAVSADADAVRRIAA